MTTSKSKISSSVVGAIAMVAAGLISVGLNPARATTSFYIGLDPTATDTITSGPTYTLTGLTNTVNGGVPGTLYAKNALLSVLPVSSTVQTYDFSGLTAGSTATGGNVISGFSSPEIHASFSGDNYVNLYDAPIPALGSGNTLPGAGTSENLGFSTVSTYGDYVLVQGGAAVNDTTFTFVNPVSSFGFFITGLGNGGTAPISVYLNGNLVTPVDILNGSSSTSGTLGASTYAVTKQNTGGAEFFGFTDTLPVTSITLGQTAGNGDRYSFDNFSFTEIVPEPTTTVAYAVGSLGLLGLLLMKRRKASASA